MTIEEVLAVEEMQVFDRKSVNIAPKVLAIPIIAFANADGGTVAMSEPSCPSHRTGPVPSAGGSCCQYWNRSIQPAECHV